MSRRLLEYNSAAKIVVICPTVPLARQQALVFVVEGFLDRGFNVDAFCGDNSIPPCQWCDRLQQYSVLVMTPQIILNILNEGGGSVNQIDMLVGASYMSRKWCWIMK